MKNNYYGELNDCKEYGEFIVKRKWLSTIWSAFNFCMGNGVVWTLYETTKFFSRQSSIISLETLEKTYLVMIMYILYWLEDKNVLVENISCSKKIIDNFGKHLFSRVDSITNFQWTSLMVLLISDLVERFNYT